MDLPPPPSSQQMVVSRDVLFFTAKGHCVRLATCKLPEPGMKLVNYICWTMVSERKSDRHGLVYQKGQKMFMMQATPMETQKPFALMETDGEEVASMAASKQGRKIDDIDKDVEITLVDETQRRYDDDLMFDIGFLDDEEVFAEQDMAEKEI
ncbi:hypothetical protein Tco_0804505 [Tanacetum coccineum]|uniref:Uncharacterized protein n=1 Tax=Tanacetum coccineum TaxID=301880 RepID=A0ABQ5A8D9_9ASTR